MRQLLTGTALQLKALKQLHSLKSHYLSAGRKPWISTRRIVYLRLQQPMVCYLPHFVALEPILSGRRALKGNDYVSKIIMENSHDKSFYLIFARQPVTQKKERVAVSFKFFWSPNQLTSFRLLFQKKFLKWRVQGPVLMPLIKKKHLKLLFSHLRSCEGPLSSIAKSA